jgi:NTE family protein
MAVGRLVDLWSDIGVEQVYRSDAIGLTRSGAGWLWMLIAGWAVTRWRHVKPRSLLDNGPLMRLLSDELQLGRVPELMRAGHLQALAIAASSYTSGHHVTFYDAIGELRPWTRSQRLAVPGRITVQHLLASRTADFVFPAANLP